MASLTNKHVDNALRLLADVAADRENKLHELSDEISETDSDDDFESPSPVFVSFLKQGSSASILTMTGLNARQFNELWISIMGDVLAVWMKGRGKKMKVSGKDALFMTLVTAKNGGTWDFLVRMFNMKPPTFERVVTRFVLTFSEPVYDRFVLSGLVAFKMSSLIEAKEHFQNFPTARYATDVSFQQAFSPSGAMEDAKKYYSGKQKLYGYKIEVSVLPIGYAIDCTNHYPGSVADIDIFYKNIDFHEAALTKEDDKVSSSIPDLGPMAAEYGDQWAVLVDKGYQGLKDPLRAIHRKRKPKNGRLDLEEERENKCISSDRIIVENWFGRHCTLWNICSSKWRWAESLFDPFYKICAFTNFHTRHLPLRATDLQFYRRVKQRLYIIGEDVTKKRKRTQERYRANRKRRLAAKFCDTHSSDETGSP